MRNSKYELLCKMKFFGSTLLADDAEAETPILWPPHVKS